MNVSYKQTDTCRCVPFTSCNVKHRNKANISFTLARRISTIVEDNNARQIRLKQIKKILVYLENLILEAIIKV